MHGINEIKKTNLLASAKFDAENTTHWITLPTGEVIISVRDTDGDIQHAQIDAKQGKAFTKDLINYDGQKPQWLHRLAVCRKYVSKARGKKAA